MLNIINSDFKQVLELRTILLHLSPSDFKYHYSYHFWILCRRLLAYNHIVPLPCFDLSCDEFLIIFPIDVSEDFQSVVGSYHSRYSISWVFTIGKMQDLSIEFINFQFKRNLIRRAPFWYFFNLSFRLNFFWLQKIVYNKEMATLLIYLLSGVIVPDGLFSVTMISIFPSPQPHLQPPSFLQK